MEMSTWSKLWQNDKWKTEREHVPDVTAGIMLGLKMVPLEKREKVELWVPELNMIGFLLEAARMDRIRDEYYRLTAQTEWWRSGWSQRRILFVGKEETQRVVWERRMVGMWWGGSGWYPDWSLVRNATLFRKRTTLPWRNDEWQNNLCPCELLESLSKNRQLVT